MVNDFDPSERGRMTPAAVASMAALWMLAAAGCRGPQPYYRYTPNYVECAIDRQECAFIDAATGKCAEVSSTTSHVHGGICYDPGSVDDLFALCQNKFCTHDVNAPGTCTAGPFSTAIAPIGQCTSAGAGSGLARVVVTYHSERAGDALENGEKPLTPIDEVLPNSPHEPPQLGDPRICLDVSKVAAMNQLAPPSTDYSRTITMTLEPNSPFCGSTPNQLIFDIAPGVVATGSAAGVVAQVSALRGQAILARSCTSGDVCPITALSSLQMDVADTTISGVQLTRVEIASTMAAPLVTINDPLQGQYLGVPTGGLRLRVNGDMNGSSMLFETSNTSPWRVDTTASSFRLRGQIILNNLGQDGAAMPITITADAHGTPATAQTTACAAESSLQRLFGFEDVQRWTSGQAALSLVTSPVTQGCGALGINGQGFMTIVGGTFTTSGLTTNAAASVDLFIPGNQPNPSYLGALQMYLTCPSGNVSNQFIGQVELTGRPQGRFSTFRFPLPATAQSTLARSLPDCSFSFTLNANPTGRLWILDNLRFTP